MPWKNMKIRSDLYEMVAQRAASETRSVAQMADVLLMRALEQEAGREDGAARGTASPVPGSERFEPAPPARASDEKADGEAGVGKQSHRPPPSSVPQFIQPPSLSPEQVKEMKGLRNIYETTAGIPGQTTVEEMLASCPQCAGAFVEHDAGGGGETVDLCEDCGFVREPEGT